MTSGTRSIRSTSIRPNSCRTRVHPQPARRPKITNPVHCGEADVAQFVAVFGGTTPRLSFFAPEIVAAMYRHRHAFMADGWDKPAGGSPAMTGEVPFPTKDVVLLAVSIYLLRQGLPRLLIVRDLAQPHASSSVSTASARGHSGAPERARFESAVPVQGGGAEDAYRTKAPAAVGALGAGRFVGSFDQ
jgi:hypothetical protein